MPAYPALNSGVVLRDMNQGLEITHRPSRFPSGQHTFPDWRKAPRSAAASLITIGQHAQSWLSFPERSGVPHMAMSGLGMYAQWAPRPRRIWSLHSPGREESESGPGQHSPAPPEHATATNKADWRSWGRFRCGRDTVRTLPAAVRDNHPDPDPESQEREKKNSEREK